MSLSTMLKEATAEAHRRAESKDLQRELVQGRLGESRLTEYLVQLHCVHAVLERLFDQHPAIARLVSFDDGHRHSHRLEHDVHALGGVTTAIRPLGATADLLREIDTAAARLPETLIGFLYVLEGSMNGNRFIVRALRHSPLAARCEFTYFDPYGEAQPERWASFKTALDDPALANHADAIIAAAQRMFDAIGTIGDGVMAMSQV